MKMVCTPHRYAWAQQGLGMIAVVVILVCLSTMAAAIVRLSFTEQATSAQDLATARAAQAANSGIQWGLYQATKGAWSTCSGLSQTLDLRADFGMWVTVSCDSLPFNEGRSAENTTRVVRLITLNAVACNGASACPDNSRVGNVGYAERRRTVQLTN